MSIYSADTYLRRHFLTFFISLISLEITNCSSDCPMFIPMTTSHPLWLRGIHLVRLPNPCVHTRITGFLLFGHLPISSDFLLMSGCLAVKICNFLDRQKLHFLDSHLYLWPLLTMGHFLYLVAVHAFQ